MVLALSCESKDQVSGDLADLLITGKSLMTEREIRSSRDAAKARGRFWVPGLREYSLIIQWTFATEYQCRELYFDWVADKLVR